MAEFVAEEGLLKGLVLTLGSGEIWTIGRDPESSDLIVEDPKVSRKHLICRKTDAGYLIENLSITNPTRVNGEVFLEPTLLQEGDNVSIGSTGFRFYTRQAPEVVAETLQEEVLFTEGEIFRDDEESQIPKVNFDLSSSNRFVFKVVSGPNTGAELALDLEKDYLIGTDTATCDIVLHDLSVSRQHARIRATKEGPIFIEDLDSRNGVIVDREKIIGKQILPPNTLVTLGTSAFFVIDREAPLATIAAPVLDRMEEEVILPEAEPALSFEKEKQESILPKEGLNLTKRPMQLGSFILSLMLVGLVVLFGVGIVSLFQEKEVIVSQEDYNAQLKKALAPFTGVKFTFNNAMGRLFLVGHVTNGIQKSEMLYSLKSLCFIRGVDDFVVDDEAIWEETNILLAHNKDFEGVSMHSPEPGKFVIAGYLEQNSQMSKLTEYMNLHFPYLDRLTYNIIVKEQILSQVAGLLLQGGFNGVTPDLINGDLTLTGYINIANSTEYQNVIKKLEEIQGVNTVRNYVVMLSPEQAVVDLNEKYPGRFNVTGHSKHGDCNVNVVINGRILMRGDVIEGMTVTSLQARTIFLEKDGLKYKIEYNK
jgi:type III secretion system YscD/HrpQ family protein